EPARGEPMQLQTLSILLQTLVQKAVGCVEADPWHAVERDELLPVELELPLHDQAGRARPGIRVMAPPAELGVLEDAGVIGRGRLAFGVEPQARDKCVVGHPSSSDMSGPLLDS